MIIARKSPFTGIVHEMDIDVTPEQLAALEAPGALIQRVLPHLTADEREFISTGITPQQWADFVGPEPKE